MDMSTRRPSLLDIERKQLIINEVELLLAEKRTSLSGIRTGLTIVALPLSVLMLLVVLSKYYDPSSVLPAIVIIGTICVVLFAFGSILILRSHNQIVECDRKIKKIKEQDKEVEALVDDLD